MDLESAAEPIEPPRHPFIELHLCPAERRLIHPAPPFLEPPFVRQRGAVPRRLAGGDSDKWNCSVPHWPLFRQHLLCNRRVECAAGEDERECPYTLCQHDGVVVAGRCYFLSKTALWNGTWYGASRWCHRHGARLASLNTPETLGQVPRLLNVGKHADYVFFVGATTSASTWPRMSVTHSRPR